MYPDGKKWFAAFVEIARHVRHGNFFDPEHWKRNWVASVEFHIDRPTAHDDVDYSEAVAAAIDRATNIEIELETAKGPAAQIPAT